MHLTPDARTAEKATPEYLRSLIASAGISQREAARRMGESDRTLRSWLKGDYPCPYPVQFCLEVLAAYPERTDIE